MHRNRRKGEENDAFYYVVVNSSLLITIRESTIDVVIIYLYGSEPMLICGPGNIRSDLLHDYYW